MTLFRDLVIDQDRMGGRVTFVFNPYKVDDAFAQQVCNDWAKGVEARIRREMKASASNKTGSAILTADPPSVLPYFESSQFHVIKDFISSENPNDQSDPKFANSISGYIDFVRSIIESGETADNALYLAGDIVEPITLRQVNTMKTLGMVAATATEIAIRTSALEKQVAAAREAGATWRQIAHAAGVDVAVAHRRWKKDTN